MTIEEAKQLKPGAPVTMVPGHDNPTGIVEDFFFPNMLEFAALSGDYVYCYTVGGRYPRERGAKGYVYASDIQLAYTNTF